MNGTIFKERSNAFAHGYKLCNNVYVQLQWLAGTHQNAVPGPGNLSLERSGCKIIVFHSWNVRS